MPEQVIYDKTVLKLVTVHRHPTRARLGPGNKAAVPGVHLDLLP